MYFIVLLFGIGLGTHQDKYDSESFTSFQLTDVTNGNYVNAGSGEDIVYGGDGNDVVFGGDGDDTLSGGEGADLFMLGLGDKYRPDTSDSGLVTASCSVNYDWETVELTGGHSGIDISVGGQATTNSNFGGNGWGHSAWTGATSAKALRFRCQANSTARMIGFNYQQPSAGDNYGALEYALFCTTANYIQVRQSGSQVFNGSSCCSWSGLSPEMKILVNEERNVEYYYDGNLIYTSSSTIPDGQSYHIAMDFHTSGASIHNMEYSIQGPTDECTISSQTTTVDGENTDEIIAVLNSGKTVLNAMEQDLEAVVDQIEETACNAMANEYDQLLVTRINELDTFCQNMQNALQGMRDSPPECPHM